MSSSSKPCIFCQEKVQENYFLESENFLAIYNLAPILPGHSMVIPKKHHQSLMELSEAELCEMTIFARKTVKLLMKAFSVTAFNWTIQEGVEAGQTVPHLHLHLIPRAEKDLPQPGDWYPLLKASEEEDIDSEARPRHSYEEIAQIVEKLRMFSQD
jgi:bis(5'-adenosyl)-triphosphatase